MNSYNFIWVLLCLMMACVFLPIQGIQIRVCNDRLETIDCPGKNQHISIRRAFYGRNNPTLCRLPYEELDRTRCGKNNNVLAKVKQLCDDKQTCSLRADKKTFGGDCPGNSAFLVVNFRCIGATTGCRKNQFKCLRNRKCIPKKKACDGIKDCPDGSDEAKCGLDEKCGKQAVQPQFITQECPTLKRMKIVGGCAAKPNSWPWAIQLRNNMSIDGSYIHQCGAVLISPSFALTASHCFLFAPDASSWAAVAGRHMKDTPGNNDQIRPISKIIPFPNPTDNLLDRDLTMIKFSRPMTINNYVAPICLPHREPKVGDDCSIAGWGDTRDTGNEAVLKQTLMPVVDREECNNTNLLKGQITEYMVCAGWHEGNNDACQGDSGGPLMCKIDDAYFLEGIISWGEDCAQPNLPGVYMNVHKAVDWIKDQMTKN